MWSKNPTPVRHPDAPAPSRSSATRTFVSFVARETSAVRLLEFVVVVLAMDRSNEDGLLRRRQRLDPAEQRVVLLARADRDADLVGQARLVEVSNENALLLEPEVCVFAFCGRGRGQNE